MQGHEIGSDPEIAPRYPEVVHSRYVISSNNITKYLFLQLEAFFLFRVSPVDFWCTQHNACGLTPGSCNFPSD